MVRSTTFTVLMMCSVAPISMDSADARTWLVNPDGSGDALTIQAGVDLAANGDTVQIARGWYIEHDIIITRGLTLLGDPDDPASVTIDAMQEGRILNAVDISSSISVRGITFANGKTQEREDPQGGAIFVSGTELDVEACHFLNNRTTDEGRQWIAAAGGAIYGNPRCVTIRDSFFAGNRAAVWGGAVHTAFCTLTISETTFFENTNGYTPVGPGGGGAIYATKGETTIRDSAFLGNRSLGDIHGRGRGGAIWGDDTKLTVVNTEFAHNTSLTWGGAIFARVNDISLSRCSFRWNAAPLGGALSLSGDAATITDCLLTNNHGAESAALSSTNSSIDVSQTTFWRNTPFAMNVVSPVGIHTTIIDGGQVGGSLTGACENATISCSNFHDNVDSDWPACVASQLGTNGNTSADPLFCDPVSGDFRLQAGSPSLPDGSGGCELVGAFGPGCPAQGRVEVRALTNLIVFGDREYVRSPAVFLWDVGTVHTVGTIAAQIPASGARAVLRGWSDGGDVERTITVSSTPIVLEAFFETEYVVRMSAQEGGSTSPTAWVPTEASHEIVALPQPGFVFGRWLGRGDGSYSGTDNPATVIPTEPLMQIAFFTNIGHSLRMVADEGGTVSPGSGMAPAHSEVIIQATPDPGYMFAGWVGSGDGSYTGPDNPVVLTIEGPIQQTARFAPVHYEVTLSLSSTDPFAHVGPPIGFGDVYLWLACGTANRGFSQVQLSVVSSMEVLGFIPATGFVSAGTPTSIFVAPTECTSSPALLGRFLVTSPGEGGMCLNGPGATPSLTITDCATTELAWPAQIRFTGVQTDGLPPCQHGPSCDGSVSAEGPGAVPVGVDEKIPTTTSLTGIHPNPIVHESSVLFDVARPGRVEMTVFDVSGRRVRTLVSAHHAPGSHAVRWDRRDAEGRVVGAGMYFVRFSGDDGEMVKKVTVLD